MKKNGFTLIELLVTVAIVGILASFGIPAYRDYIIRSQATEGITALSDMKVKLEQYFQDNRTYIGACATGTLAPVPTGLKYFTVSCPTLSDDGYIIRATSAETGFTYVVDEANSRSTTAAPTNYPTSATCWVTSKTGCN